MTNRLGAMVVLLSCVSALAATPGRETREPRDAFLSGSEGRPLVDARALSPEARTALQLGQVTSTEPRLGVPTVFWAERQPRGARTLRAAGVTAEQAARRYLASHAELYRGAPARWAEAVAAGVHDRGPAHAVIVTFQQRVEGLRVFRDEVKVVMTGQLELVALTGYLTPAVRPLGSFRLSESAAVASAFADMTGQGLEADALQDLGERDGYRRFALRGESSPARVRPTWFPLAGGLEPGLYVELDLASPTTGHDAFSYVVSAVDGRVLYRKDLVALDAYAYRVWADGTPLGLPLDGPQGADATPHPTGQPDGFSPGFVPQVLVTREYGPISTQDPWLPAAATETRGNNAWAYADISRSNGFGTGDVAGLTSGPGAFDYLFDPATSPEANETQRRAAITQLFYTVNFFHDWYYDVGFDEASGNAQTSNLGRGGLGGDVLLAEAQDYSGRNNASMSTPSDGASPRMQMHVFDSSASGTLVANTTPPQSFGTGAADFGPTSYDVTAEIVLVDDGQPAGGTVNDACGATGWVTDVTGKVALIDRGVCNFILKAQNAQTNGAVAVIIADNQNGATPPPLAGSGTASIPSVSVTRASGQTLRALPAGTTVTLRRQAAPDHDGALDNAVVAHEWGHYISNRLIGDGNGISNLQAIGMGEGWGDFHAMLMTVRAEDALVPSNVDFGGVYGLAGFVAAAEDPNGYYFGLRRVPYSTDMTKNGLTFKHIQANVALPANVPTAFGLNGRQNAEYHNTGEVWATMLWECYAALLRDSQRLGFEEARERMRAYLVAAYKATPLMPTFVDARDALLAVAAAEDPADYAAFWGAFAKRGLGMLATAPDRDARNNAPVVESFEVGNALSIVGVALDDSIEACDADGNLDAFETGLLTITVKSTGVSEVTQGTVTVASTSPGLSFPQGASVALPPLMPFASAEVKVRVAAGDLRGIGAGEFDVTVAAPSLLAPGSVSQQAMFRLNYDVQPSGARIDDVEAPTSLWTSASDPNGNTGSNWRIFQTSATQHFWFGPNPSSPADTWLISPPLDFGDQPVVITFKHRFDFETDASDGAFYDGAVLELSTDDGRTWRDIGTSAIPGYTGTLDAQGSNPLRGRQAWARQSPDYPDFATERVELGTAFANQTVRVRFRIGSDDLAAAHGWDVDDIAFEGITNAPFPAVVADANACDNAPPTVTAPELFEVDEGSAVQLLATMSDPDGDALTATWVQTSGPEVQLHDGAFTAPMVEADLELGFELTVTDGRAVVGPLPQTVLVRNSNRAPTASAPAHLEVVEGQAVTITGTGVDPDGDALDFEWTQADGPALSLTGAATPTVGFTAPAAGSVLTLQLVVSDAEYRSAPAVVEVVVKTAAEATSPGDDAKGCGCSTGVGGLGWLGLVAFGWLRRRRERRG